MTVGILLNDPEKAYSVVVTDSRVSFGYRQSDSVTKCGVFSTDDYQGVIFGAGDGNLINCAIQELNKVKKEYESEDLECFARSIMNNQKHYSDRMFESYIDNVKEEVARKGRLFVQDPTKCNYFAAKSLNEVDSRTFMQQQALATRQAYDQFMKGQIDEYMKRYDQEKYGRSCTLVVSGFDKSSGKVKNYYITPSSINESFMDHIEIGSGQDGAQMYLSNRLQGTNTNKSVSLENQVFHAINAFNYSTINNGVGGTPSVTRVHSEGVESYTPSQATMLANLSGAYLSCFAEGTLTQSVVKRNIKSILDKDESQYPVIAEQIGLNLDSFKNLIIPFSSWQSRTNHLLESE